MERDASNRSQRNKDREKTIEMNTEKQGKAQTPPDDTPTQPERPEPVHPNAEPEPVQPERVEPEPADDDSGLVQRLIDRAGTEPEIEDGHGEDYDYKEPEQETQSDQLEGHEHEQTHIEDGVTHSSEEMFPDTPGLKELKLYEPITIQEAGERFQTLSEQDPRINRVGWDYDRQEAWAVLNSSPEVTIIVSLTNCDAIFVNE